MGRVNPPHMGINMTIVLVHPIHGAKVAICEEEVTADEKQGWTRYIQVEVDTDKAVSSRKPARGRSGKERADTIEEVPDFLSQGGTTPEVE